MFCSALFFAHPKGKVESFLSSFALHREKERYRMISDNFNDYVRILVFLRFAYEDPLA